MEKINNSVFKPLFKKAFDFSILMKDLWNIPEDTIRWLNYKYIKINIL